MLYILSVALAINRFVILSSAFAGRKFQGNTVSTRHPLSFETKILAVSIDTSNNSMPSTQHTDSTVPPRQLLIHWRGEKDSGYSKQFRQLEFTSALEAVLGLPYENPLFLSFHDALKYTGQAAMTDVNIEHFNEAMQYVEFSPETLPVPISTNDVIQAAQRCSLVHALYEVIASADDINDLAPLAIQDGGFADMYRDGENGRMTWCFRARNYRDPSMSDSGREKRYGSRARSMALEKTGLAALKDLLILFGGKVDLIDPDCKIYIFDGLLDKGTTLTRRIASGPKTSLIAPATRICITTTPLCPIASFSLCNVARITNTSKILDPYAGSCAILLAAAMIAPQCQTVGIEIANSNIVNRDDIRKDFDSRHLTPPQALLQGDCTDPDLRRQAREAIVGSLEFDAIIADPPYGIRESKAFNDNSPLEELFAAIIFDRENGHRLLRKGGRLVAFVPVTDEETFQDVLPNQKLTEEAGLLFEVCREQPLNEKLSRWLASFICIR